MQYFDDPAKALEYQIIKENEKKQIKRTATALGVTYTAVLAVSVFWAAAVVYLLESFALPSGWFFSSLEDAGALQYVQIVLSFIMFVVPFTILFKWSGLKSDEVFKFSRPKKGTFLPLALIGLGFCAFSNISNSISGQIFINMGFPDPFTEAEYPLGLFGFALSFLSTAIMPALVEEFAMRGVFLGLLRRFGDRFALITSSVLFGLIHANFEQIVFATFVGLVLGFVYIKSGSIWTAVAVHFANNAASVLIYYLAVYAGDTAANIVYSLYLAVSLALAIIGLFMLSAREENPFELDNGEMLSRNKMKFKWFFTSPMIIISVVLTFVLAIFLR